jgi:hypothetical protein
LRETGTSAEWQGEEGKMHEEISCEDGIDIERVGLL